LRATELFLSTAHVKVTHIPYRGVPEAQQAVMSGQVAAFFDMPITALPQINTPRPIIDKLNKAVVTPLQSPVRRVSARFRLPK
jgi:Tripartite tricarboxylate transporter family receptor